MDDRALEERLAAFGFSEKEIDTYLAVLDSGEAKTSTVAERAGVSQRYVYSLAEQLENRGLVEVHDHAVPTTIRAVPPEQAVSGLVERLQSIRPELDRRFTKTAPETATFDVIKSRQTVLKRIRSLLAAASEEVFLALPSGTVDELDTELAAAIERDVAVLLLESNTDRTLDELSARERFAGRASVVRRWGEDFDFVVVADATAGLVGERGLLTGAHGNQQAVALTQIQVVGSLFGSFIGSFWPMGTEAYVADPTALPTTYEMFRPAVLQATLHDRQGTDLVVTAAVEPKDGANGKTISGPVIETRQGLIEPFSNSFPVENAIIVETDDGSASIGGVGSFIEDYVAHEVTLEMR